MSIILQLQTNHAAGGDDAVPSTSLPFPLSWLKLGDIDAPGEAGSDGLDALPPSAEPASCHAGIEGLGGMIGVEMPEGVTGPRLSNNAFSDLSSCCSSASD